MAFIWIDIAIIKFMQYAFHFLTLFQQATIPKRGIQVYPAKAIKIMGENLSLCTWRQNWRHGYFSNNPRFIGFKGYSSK